jgi:1-acyl-sn-glycerol-3-phosphate acyltransferase
MTDVEQRALSLRRSRRSLLASQVGDRLVRFAERLHGDEIDARLRAIHTHKNEAGFDPFGFDPDTTRYVLALAVFLHRVYFRTQVFGLEHVVRGRALYIANHSGQLPIDGMLIEAALMLDATPPVLARSMVEKWAQRLPFVATLFPRVGQVLGSPDNARRLLESDNALLVFPEGARGIAKPFSERYRLQEFGLGFMRLAIETSTPIVPVAVIGGEEQYPAVADLKGLARMLGMPAFPVLPQLLFGMALPLPTRYRLHLGAPMRFSGDPDEEDSEIDARVQKVRMTIQTMVEQGLRQRERIFW